MSGKHIARRWFDEVWNQRDATAISRMFAKDGIAHGLGPNGEDLIGPTGHGMGFAPTGKQMNITGMSIIRVQDGQIVEAWNNFDVLGMHQQLDTLAAVTGI